MNEESPKGLTFFDREFSSDLLAQLNSLRQDEVFTDVMLCTGDREFSCHRNVLVSSSPYFKAMFCSNFRERFLSKITLPGISSDALSQLLDYVYTGTITITTEGVLPLMETAALLQYSRLFEACSSFLLGLLNPKNCLSMIRLSEAFGCSKLGQKAKDIALRRFSDVAASEEFRELSLRDLIDYLGDDQLCLQEEQVFEVLMAWIHCDLQSRKDSILDLFRNVRLQHVHPTYLFQFIANEPLIKRSAVCTGLIEALRRTTALSLPKAPRRCASHESLVLVGGRKNNQQTARDVLLYEEASQKWQWLSKLPLRLYKSSSVLVHGVLYILGGLVMNGRKAEVTSNVYTFSFKSHQWRRADPMLEPHYAHTSIASMNYIFVLGGLGLAKQVSNDVERYNIVYNLWEAMAPMPVAVLHPAVAVKDQRIYVFGGEDAKQYPVRLIQVYHMTRNLWHRLETRTVKNVYAPAAVLDDRIFIVGGYTRRMIAYDPKTNTFTNCASLKERRMHHGATVIDNKLYITGGRFVTSFNVIQDSDCVDCYDPKTDCWSSKGRLPYKVFDHGVHAFPRVGGEETPV
ncbi:kelch-like protein 38 [Erpetoichthys calabaricus]|uniref:Kelch-like family member 38a n=1 Tax=Erpetoichthys calabaricus TaxID=27687 RepID=A0A8C4SUP4_ERPCA|nr:kelch-like protein 38 [Erpetoichthys calabaricus]